MSEQNQMTQVYDEYGIKHQAAYTVYVKTYELENPRPDLATVSRDVVSLIIVLFLTVVSIASIIVSGSRTIEEFGGGTIGLIAFVMIEGGIMAYGFFIARRNASKKRLQNTVKWAMAGLVLTVIVGLGANADSVLRKHGIDIPKEVNLVINLLVALSAPALAFISSDVLAIELMATEIRRREAQIEHEKKTRKWLKDLNKSWRMQQSNWGAKIKVQKPEALKIEAVNPVKYSNLQENTRFTPSRKLQVALDYFEVHPEDLSTESRKLQETIGVSHTTINKAQRMMRGDNNHVS